MRDKKEITSDDIESNGVRWCMADTADKCLAGRARAPFIVNTARSDDSSGGLHWITARLFGKRAFVFDPLGPRNQRPNDALLTDSLKRAGAEKIVEFPFAVQDKATTHCGWFALAVAKLIRRARTPLGAIRAIERYFGPASKVPLENVAQLVRSGGYVP